MSWNYRVVKHVYLKALEELDHAVYTVREVYYNETGQPNGWTAREISPHGGSPEEVRADVERYIKAFTRPVVMVDAESEQVIGEEPPIVGVQLTFPSKGDKG